MFLPLEVDGCCNTWSAVGRRSAKFGPSTSGGTPYSISSPFVFSSAPGGGFSSTGGDLAFPFSPILSLWSFQNLFLSSTVN